MSSLVSSDSEAESNNSESSSDSEQPAIKTPGKGKMLSYEKQRLQRIEENKARMEALGIRKLTTSLLGSLPKAEKKMACTKGKKKVGAEEDDEYKPSEGEEGFSSSDEDVNNDGFSISESKKSKKTSSSSKKRALSKPPVGESDSVNDDDALMQAIALSLQDSVSFLDVSKTPAKTDDAHIMDEKSRVKRKRKQSIRNRVQMTEDEFILHFFQFDEAGKGSIGLRDIQRVAAAHDFLWSDEELGGMIHCFDSDGDGKLSLDDFRKIVVRCNMIQGSENAAS